MALERHKGATKSFDWLRGAFVAIWVKSLHASADWIVEMPETCDAFLSDGAERVVYFN